MIVSRIFRPDLSGQLPVTTGLELLIISTKNIVLTRSFLYRVLCNLADRNDRRCCDEWRRPADVATPFKAEENQTFYGMLSMHST